MIVAAVGCVISDVDLDGLPCPCASTAWQCDEATNTCQPAVPGPYSLTVTRAWNILPQSRSGALTVELATETQQSILIRFVDLPTGVTASPGTLTLSPSEPVGTMSLTASTAAAIGTVTLELEGTGPAGDRQVEPVRIEIGGRPGTLDTTFGISGIATGVTDATFPVMALRPDDRIVVAAASGRDCFVTQFTADGALDTEFGSDGVTRTSTGSTQISCGAHGIELQPDDKIVVAGRWDIPGTPAIMRYLAGGGADPSFGEGGVTVLPDILVTLMDVAVRSDGRLLAVGSVVEPGTTNGRVALFRFLADGTPDPDFGTGGRIVTSLGSTHDFATALHLLADDSIVVAGHRRTSPPQSLLARFSADGVLDTGFGTGGIVLGEPMTAFAVLVPGPGDTLIAGGSRWNGELGNTADGSFVARYDSAGQLDPSFGDGGVTLFASTQPPNTAVTGIVTTPLAPLLVSDTELLMALDAAGNLDPEFGYVPTPIDKMSGLAIQSSGKLIALVASFSSEVSLMRLWP